LWAQTPCELSESPLSSGESAGSSAANWVECPAAGSSAHANASSTGTISMTATSSMATLRLKLFSERCIGGLWGGAHAEHNNNLDGVYARVVGGSDPLLRRQLSADLSWL